MGKLRGHYPVHHRKDRQVVHCHDKGLEAPVSGWLEGIMNYVELPGQENLCMTKSSTSSAEGRSSGPDCKHFWTNFQSESIMVG